MSRTKTRCSACKKRIPAHESDVLLRTLERAPGWARYYHERCTSAAVALVLSEPEAWHMTVRHVDAMAN